MSVQIRPASHRRAPWMSTATWINTNNESLSAAQVIENAKLDWTVVHTPLRTNFAIDTEIGAKPMSIKLDDKVATTRINKDGSASVLGITSPTYSIVQNSEIVDMVDAVTYESGAVYQSAGELRGGKKIFLAAKLPDALDLTIAGVDPIDAYLVASNTHDGTDSLRFEVKYLRLVCQNGMTRWTSASSIAFRHSSRMNVQIGNVRDALGVILKSTREFDLLSSQLMQTKVDNSEFYRIVADLLPKDEANLTSRQIQNVDDRRQALVSIWNGETQSNIRGTAWGVVNAFTEFEQWARTSKTATDFAVGERFMLNQGTSLSDRVLEMVR